MPEPILVQPEEEVTDVLDRLRRQATPEVLVVVPAASRLAESRFNFQLLALHAAEAGQHLVVESDDERVLAFAAEAGLLIREYASPAAAAAAPRTVATWRPEGPLEEYADYLEYPDPPAGEVPADGEQEAYQMPPPGYRGGPWRPERFGPAVAGWRGPWTRRRLAVCGAVAAAILVAALVAAILLVPSATITLGAPSRAFSTAVDLKAQPGSAGAGITVRTQSAHKQVSGSFQASGQKDTPGATAAGAVQYRNDCGILGEKLQVSQGAVLTSQSGVAFVQQQSITIDPGQTQTASVQAQAAGSNGNVAAGQITTLRDAGMYASCLKVTNPAPTTGGTDPQQQPLVTQQDVTNAEAQLQQQAEQAIQSQLAADVRSGEQQSDQNPVIFGSPTFTVDHPAGSTVQTFNATLTVTGTSAYYRPSQVVDAFRAELRARVPAGRQLTSGGFAAQYQTTASAGGQLEFKGQAVGRIAPKLQLDQIRSHLAGSSTGSARRYLHGLPVSQVSITGYPFSLPLLPFLSSRISVDYFVEAPPAPTASPAGSTH